MKNHIKEKIADKRRNKVVLMAAKGYPQEYIAEYMNISKGRVSQILKENEAQKKLI